MKWIGALTLLALGTLTAFADSNANNSVHPTKGVIEMFDFGSEFGRLTRVASGVPRAEPNPALEAIERWRVSAEAFARRFSVGQGANGSESFVTRRVHEDEIGRAHIRLTQNVRGLPVVGAELIVHADYQTGNIVGVHGRLVLDRDLPRSPALDAEDAVSIALRELDLTTASVVGASTITYIIDDRNEVRLAWTNTITYQSAAGSELDRIYADALTGAAVARHPLVRRARERLTYNCGNTENKCYLWFGEQGPGVFPDAAALAAYENAGEAYDYFSEKYSRDSFDNSGKAIKQYIHYASATWDNAGWFVPDDPSDPRGIYEALVYGDAVNTYAKPLGSSLDVVGHEFTHGVVFYETAMPYSGEQAAIDEGLADVFAIAIDAYRDGTPDWRIGEDLFMTCAGCTPTNAMRYLDDPALKADHIDYYPNRRLSYPHQNAGICGLAFYLMAQGGSHPRRPSVSVSGIGIDDAALIFYHTITTYMTGNTNFRTLRKYTLQAAAERFGSSSAAYSTVNNAWAAVGNHWDERTSTLLAGTSWKSPYYVTTMNGGHTGQLTGPAGANFDLFLEKWIGVGTPDPLNDSLWTVRRSSINSGSTEELSPTMPPATYRWRIQATAGSGSYSFYWNHP